MQDRTIQTYLEEKHPRLYTAYSVVANVWRYVLGGYIILALSRWLITTCGRIAESALLFCTMWITSQSVAPELFTGLGEGRIRAMTSVTLLLLALLPEVVLFSAIITALERTRVALAKKTAESMVWAILFLLPTLAFFAMTCYTLVTLALTDHIIHQDHWAIVTRCLSAWAYALIGIVYASWKRGVHGEQVPVPDTELFLQGLEEANRVAIQEAVQHLSTITVQLVEETVNRTVATVALSTAQIEAPQESVNPGESTCSPEQQSEQEGEQQKRYAPLVQALYQQRNTITVTEIVDTLGCSRSTASKWLHRVRTA